MTTQITEEQAQKAAQATIEALGNARESFIELGKAMAAAMAPISQVFGQFYDGLYQAYLDDGAIYGETGEGMLRWLDEQE